MLVTIFFQVYTIFPKSGYIYAYETGLPVADLDVYVIHHREYRFTLGMEKLSGECVLLHHGKTNRYGHYSVGWIPFFKRDPLSPRKKLTFTVDAYIPLSFDRESGRIGKVYELHYLDADRYQYGYAPPDLYVKGGVFNILKRVYRIAKFLDRNQQLCGTSFIDQKAQYEQLVARMKPELTRLYPLWLQYLRDHPYDILSGPYNAKKSRGDALFLEFFGHSIWGELARASYPNATAACEKIYPPQEQPNDIVMNWEACFGESHKLNVQGDTH